MPIHSNSFETGRRVERLRCPGRNGRNGLTMQATLGTQVIEALRIGVDFLWTAAWAIAVVSFVGSMGNVPFAVALWGGGVSFAAVIVFVYADFITAPLLNVYRRGLGVSGQYRDPV